MMARWTYCCYLVLIALASVLDIHEAVEYCHHQDFDISCEDNQVVVMTSAVYGRMSVGKCITTDFGFLGCYIDVMEDVHSRCSGRRSCFIPVPDPVYDKSVSCHKELNNYLDVEYNCINVTVPETETCQHNTSTNLTQSGFIASVVTKETGCGNEFSPWIILALPGQRINITLFDYKRKSIYSNEKDNTEVRNTNGIESAEQILCKELAIVEEDDIKTPLSSCEGNGVIDPGGTRYTSISHNVTLYMRSRALDNDAQFVIKYDIVGCPDVEPTKLTWVLREGEKISVGCLSSDLAWHMTCGGTVWQGEMGNCSAGSKTEARKDGDGASVVIIIVVSGIVGILVLIVGLVCMKRVRARRAFRGEVAMKDIRPLNQDGDNPDNDVLYARNNAFMPSRIRFGKQKLGKTKKKDEDHEYEYVWDMSGTTKRQDADGSVQTATTACVVAARGTGTPKSPRAVHAQPPDVCHCPEIHVHVHHTTENRGDGQSQVSRVHIQARADTMPRMAATVHGTPGSSRRDGQRTPGTLRAIQAPPTPGRNRDDSTPHKQTHTMGRPSGRHQCHSNSKKDPDGGEKRYWTLPVKSAFKAKQNKPKIEPPPESTG